VDQTVLWFEKFGRAVFETEINSNPWANWINKIIMSFNVGDEFEQIFKVNETVYQGFIQVFEDNNPLHTDQYFAVAQGFEDKVMHGNILNGFLSFFIGKCLPTDKVIIHWQEIQFKNAVYLNDELSFFAEVIGTYASVSAVEFKYVFKNKQATIVAKGKFQIGLFK
jgi:3-hydroxybutyryl-CoA dehydratase